MTPEAIEVTDTSIYLEQLIEITKQNSINLTFISVTLLIFSFVVIGGVVNKWFKL